MSGRIDRDICDLERKVEDIEEKMLCLKHDIKAVDIKADRLEKGILLNGEVITNPAQDAAIIRSMQKEIERLSGLLAFCLQEADKVNKMKEKVDRLWQQSSVPKQ